MSRSPRRLLRQAEASLQALLEVLERHDDARSHIEHLLADPGLRQLRGAAELVARAARLVEDDQDRSSGDALL